MQGIYGNEPMHIFRLPGTGIWETPPIIFPVPFFFPMLSIQCTKFPP